MIRIIIGGDICPAGRVENLFIEGKGSDIFHNLLEDIKNSDFSIANLECPLVNNRTPITKAGPVLSADEKCVNGIKSGGWKAINLANNHSYDHGHQGLINTMNSLNQAGISHFGAGMNLSEAQKPLHVNIKGQEIIFYSMAEQEFSVATEDTAGSNPLDIINFVNAIRNYKNNNSFIVLLHGGVEYYPYPTPETVRRCRFMIDIGADAVICGHTHCPQPWEIYKKKPIVYSLGNLVFEFNNIKTKSWSEGYLAELEIDNDSINFRPIPYVQSLNFLGAKKMNDSQHNDFIKQMNIFCSQIIQKGFVENQWKKYCSLKESYFLSSLFGYNRIMQKFARIILPILHPLPVINNSLLTVCCESHREVLIAIFKKYSHSVNTSNKS